MAISSWERAAPIAPWHFKSADDKLQGFDVDMGHIIAKALFGDPDKIEFVDQSSHFRIPNITTGKVDVTCQFMTVTGERAQQVAFTIPYYREGVGLMMTGGQLLCGLCCAEGRRLCKVTIATLQNVYAEAMVHAALPDAKVDQYDLPGSDLSGAGIRVVPMRLQPTSLPLHGS